MPFIAGEDLRSGEMVVYGDDGRLYRADAADRGTLKSIAGMADRNYRKDEPVQGMFTLRRSLLYRWTRWLRRLSYRLRGRIYPYLD